MTRQEILAKARRSRKPKLVFNSRSYSILKTFRNYEINIKLPLKKGCKTIDRDCYPFPEHGIMGAHETAKYMIDSYFRS